jgi:hypothetical protein
MMSPTLSTVKDQVNRMVARKMLMRSIEMVR